MKWYDRCLKINPENLQALYGKSLIYQKTSPRELEKTLLRILEISPFDTFAIEYYARLLRERGEKDAALNFLAEKCKDEEVAKYPLVSFEISYLVKDLFTKLKLNKSFFDDYYKIKKILRLKGFNKETIGPAIDKVMFVNVEVTFNVMAIHGNEPLRKLAIEKSIVPEHTDENYINTNRENWLKIWLVSDVAGKVKIVDSMKEYFKNNGVIIKRSSNFYVAMINIQITPIFKDNVYDPKLGYEWDNNLLIVALKSSAIMIGDYDNGRNKLELLKEVIGEKGIEKLKKDQPDKYEDFLNG